MELNDPWGAGSREVNNNTYLDLVIDMEGALFLLQEARDKIKYLHEKLEGKEQQNEIIIRIDNFLKQQK